MFLKIFNRKIKEVNALFMGHYVDVKVLYAMLYDELPCVNFIGELDTSKAMDFINNRFKYGIKEIYQHSFFDHDKQDLFFNNTVFVLNGKRIIELGNNFCHVLHTRHQYDFGHKLIKELSAFRMTAVTENEIRVVGFARGNHTN
jgi:hypothetical protein